MIETTICCDACGVVGDADRRPHLARRRLRVDQGWLTAVPRASLPADVLARIPGGDDGLPADLCADCRPARAAVAGEGT